LPLLFAAGIMLSHSPPVSTPIEPCRVAPYVSVPSLRLSPAAYDRLPFAAVAAAAAAAFPAFDPAILSAAHQVKQILYVSRIFKPAITQNHSFAEDIHLTAISFNEISVSNLKGFVNFVYFYLLLFRGIE